MKLVYFLLFVLAGLYSHATSVQLPLVLQRVARQRGGPNYRPVPAYNVRGNLVKPPIIPAMRPYGVGAYSLGAGVAGPNAGGSVGGGRPAAYGNDFALHAGAAGGGGVSAVGRPQLQQTILSRGRPVQHQHINYHAAGAAANSPTAVGRPNGYYSI